jgi:hypothetical protein
MTETTEIEAEAETGSTETKVDRHVTTGTIDRHTRAGHERFKKAQSLTIVRSEGREPERTSFVQWLEWQATRDPLKDFPKEAKKVREQIEAERRGPGISKRGRSTKKIAAHPPRQKD